jgi:hypothetical protein
MGYFFITEIVVKSFLKRLVGGGGCFNAERLQSVRTSHYCV